MNVTSLYTQLFGATGQNPEYHRPHPAVEAPALPLQANLNSSNSTAEVLSKEGDYQGSMLFCVAVICVYGLSIVAFIAGHLKKRQINKEEETQISYYLKRMQSDKQAQMDTRFHVVRLKSQLLSDSAMGQRHNRRESLVHKGSRDERAGFHVRSWRTPNGTDHCRDDDDGDDVFRKEKDGGCSPSFARPNGQSLFGCSAESTTVTVVNDKTGIAASVPLSLSRLWQNGARGRHHAVIGCSYHDENEYGNDNEENEKSKSVYSPKLSSRRPLPALPDIDECDDDDDNDDDNFLQSNNSRKGLLANQRNDPLCSLPPKNELSFVSQ